MPNISLIHILWDASHIWGLMLWRALRALGLPCRLSKGKEIAEGLLLRNCGTHSLFVVPGGNARLKAEALGEKGLAAVRSFVVDGGSYLGICGGAGLALTNHDSSASLNLCPWSRKPYPDRLQHLASGHVQARLSSHPLCPPKLLGETISLPVWWPGRFSAIAEPSVTVLARATRRDSDFWLGDLPLETIPKNCFDIWKAEYGLDLSSDFLNGMPLVVTGHAGKGRYVLSYSHLETPESSEANLFLSHLVSQLTHDPLPKNSFVPTWELSQANTLWPAALKEALLTTRRLLALGATHHLFFQRTSWLWGWKSGLPGAAVNSLHTALATLNTLTPSKEAEAYWEKKREAFEKTLALFSAGAEESLLTGRIASVLGNLLPHGVKHRDFKDRQELIFGSPRDGGGLLGSLLDITEELIYLAQKSFS